MRIPQGTLQEKAAIVIAGISTSLLGLTILSYSASKEEPFAGGIFYLTIPICLVLYAVAAFLLQFKNANPKTLGKEALSLAGMVGVMFFLLLLLNAAASSL